MGQRSPSKCGRSADKLVSVGSASRPIWSHSLAIVGVDPGVSLPRLARQATELANRNHRLLAAGDDLWLDDVRHSWAISHDGAGCAQDQPTVCLHTFPIPFHLWAEKYEMGRIAGNDERHASARAMLAGGTEMPQPHALLPGRRQARDQEPRPAP